MSYILDALRRADAERERGPVPGLHAQPAWAPPVAVGAGGQTPSGGRSMARVAGGVVVLMLILWLAWRAFGVGAVGDPGTGGGAPAPAQGAAVPPATLPPPPMAEAPATGHGDAPTDRPTVGGEPTAAGRRAAAVTSDKSAIRAARKPAATVATVPAAPPAETTPSAAPGPSTAPATSAAPGPSSLPMTAKAPPTSKPAMVPATPSASAPAAAKVYTVDELPDDIRRDLPKLSVGGSIYSESPASRFVIVNGQLLHEGDAVAPGLVLQQIRLKSAVLAFRGYRYTIAY